MKSHGELVIMKQSCFKIRDSKIQGFQNLLISEKSQNRIVGMKVLSLYFSLYQHILCSTSMNQALHTGKIETQTSHIYIYIYIYIYSHIYIYIYIFPYIYIYIYMTN